MTRSEPARTTRPATEGAALDENLVTVVICTLGREPRLRDTVRSVLQQKHADLEVVVVDNDPSSGRTAALLADVDDPRLRILGHPVRGLSSARNAGLRAARGGLVAYTDDDAVADPAWIEQLLAALAADREGVVTCVTGRVVATETTTRAQEWFEDVGMFDKGLEHTVWTLRPGVDPALGTPGNRTIFFPYTAGEMGVGNNMLFRTPALRALGGFDEALGAGSPAKGGEDLDIFRRVVLAGEVVLYTPEALVRHHHRATYDQLRRQMFGYGVGMAASLTKVLVHGGRPALGVLRCFPRGVYTLLAPGSTKNVKNPEQMSRALVAWELLGYAVGPLLYLYSLARTWVAATGTTKR